jgi:hypothetical protein
VKKARAVAKAKLYDAWNYSRPTPLWATDVSPEAVNPRTSQSTMIASVPS